jgi:CheY-like chemotaxis protein
MMLEQLMSIQARTARVLIVDDDPVFLSRATVALDGITDLRSAPNGRRALAVVGTWRPDIILLDMLLEDLDGFTFLEQLSDVGLEHPPFILCTTDGHGAGTRVRPLPSWQVGTILRSSTSYQIRDAVLQAVSCHSSSAYGWITA